MDKYWHGTSPVVFGHGAFRNQQHQLPARSEGDHMSGIVHTVTALPRIRTVAAALVAAAVAFSLTQVRGRAESNETDLPYARGYLLTGNYVASGIDLTEEGNPPDQNGLSTGTIHITKCNPPTVVFDCVPADADIVAAYVYWEAIVANGDLTEASGVQFRGEDILLNDLAGVKASWADLTGSTSSCWSSGSPLKMVHFRADVLRFLPIRLDKDNKPTGKRLVTDQDLTDNGLPLHTVRMPTRNGNQIPESAGASLVLVYRDPNEPLRKVVIYDGIDIQQSLTDTMSKTIRGFYQSASSKSAKITHIIGSGQPNNNEVVSFDVTSGNTTVSTPISPFNPILGTSSSERAWSTLTYDVGQYMNPPAAKTSLTEYGETVTTTVAHSPANGGYDCLAWAGVIFSTAVADRDHDGVPDGIEDSTQGLKDPPTSEFPQGQPLPNLNAMGSGSNTVSSDNPDVFIEINAMQTSVTKSHGAQNAPYPGVTAPAYSNPVPAHTHMPTPDVLATIGNAYKAKGIRAHFDVGDITAYKSRASVVHTDWTDVYNASVADDYLIPSGTRGGEVVDERACDASNENCQFPGYPGTVSWKVGLQIYRDSPVNDATGAEFQLNQQGKLVVPQTWAGRRRFDRNRFGLFHYLLYAHYRGKPRSEFPCLDTSTDPDTPIDYPNGTSCSGPQIKVNPDFHTPTSASGVADLPGGNAMITLGFWDEFVGRPFVQASTTFHELGHNYNLWHGGNQATWGDKFLGTSTYIEPNCKPNYLSSMSYLFQVQGLFTNDDAIELNFSGEPLQNNLGEATPETDGPLSPTPSPAYRTAWYAPFSSALATTLGVPEAKRYCHGEAFGSVNPHMARVYTLASNDAIDWDGDPNTTSALSGQDINFDHAVNTTLLGFNDWANLRLDQISAGRNAVKFQDGEFLDFGSGDFLDFGSGDFLDFGSGDFLDFGSGDFLDFGSGVIFNQDSGDFLDFGSGDFLDFGSGDFLDFGSGDFLDFGSGSERQELDFELAKGLGRTPPYSLKGCVISENEAPDCITAAKYSANYHRSRASWKPPTFGRVTLYQIFRKRGMETSSYSYPPASQPTGTSTTTSFIDPQQLPDGEYFTYKARATFDDNVISSYSKSVSIQAKNDPPELAADTYTTVRNRNLSRNAAEGVVANDNDPDSPKTAIVVQLVTPPAHGTLTLNPDGSFTYRPQGGYTGPDEFWYTATNGTWTADLPNIPMNSVTPAAVRVSITVTAR
jgi:cadherin-like protein